MEKHILSAIATAGLLIAGFASPAMAQAGKTSPAQNAQTQQKPTTAQGYLAKAQQGNLFEIEAGRIAMQRAQNINVQTFGRHMVEQHGLAMAKWNNTAKDANITAPAAVLDERHAAKLSKLWSVSVNAFDRHYVADQLEAHKNALKLHKHYAENGDNASLRRAAGAMVPMIEEHLQNLNRLSADLVVMTR